MNRDIKFRVWYYDQKKFDYDVTLKDFKKYSFPLYWGKMHQFTGLKDKNGKDIYEEDLIEDILYKHIHLIYWDNKLLGFNTELIIKNLKAPAGTEYTISWDEINDFQIIGNIFENPELLN